MRWARSTRAGTRRAGGAARQDQGVRRTLSQDPELERLNAELEDRVRARTAELEESHRGCSRANSAAAWRSPPARWAPGTGTGSTATGCGTKASTGFSGSIPEDLRGDAGQHPGAAASGRHRTAAQGDGPVHQGRQLLRSRIPHRPARRRGALVRRHGRRDASTRAAASCASAASPSTSPNASAPRNGRTCWRARSTIAPRMRWRWRNRSCG